MVRESKTVYPSQYETMALLKDGSSILFRPIRGDDAARWLAFVSRLSPHTKYLRFYHMPKEMGLDDAIRFCTVDYDNTFALVAEVLREPNSEIVGLGRYYRLPKKHLAEVDFAIEDAYQDRGIGTSLIQHLANAREKMGLLPLKPMCLLKINR
jgi:acetyltransferase